MIDCCSVKSKDMKHCKEIRYYALKTTAATSPLIVRYLLLKISFHEWLQNICAVKVVEFWHEWSVWSSFFFPSACVCVCSCMRVRVEPTRQVTQRGDESLLHKHKYTSVASKMTGKWAMNAGKLVTAISLNCKRLNYNLKDTSLEIQRVWGFESVLNKVNGKTWGSHLAERSYDNLHQLRICPVVSHVLSDIDL